MNISSAHVDVFKSVLSMSNCNMTDRELATIELFQNYPDGLLNFTVISCMVLMTIGIPANLITIIALARYEKVRNATTISIMNLSFSDLLFCCLNLSMATSTFYSRSWALGSFLCRMFAFAHYGLSGVSLFTITMITINRYVIIAHPMLYPKLYRRRYFILMHLSTWILPFGILIFTWFGKWGCFRLDVCFSSCIILPDVHDSTSKRLLLPVTFLLTLLVVIICYARIFYIVKKVTRASRDTVFRKTSNTVQEDSSLFTNRQSNNDLSAEHEKPKKINNTPKISNRFERKDDTIAANEDDTLKIDCSKTALGFRGKNSRLTKKNKKLVTMIMAIMVSFCICHLPITIRKILHNYTSNPVPNIVGYIFLCMSTCVNPVIYVVMSSEYRQAYKNLFKRGK